MAAAVLEDAAERRRPALAARLRREALAERNRLLHELGRRFFPGGTLRARARRLIAAVDALRNGRLAP